MKNFQKKKISLSVKLIYLLIIITIIVSAFSMARFQTTLQDRNFGANNANWQVKFNVNETEAQNDFHILLADTSTNANLDKKDNVVAPSDYGSFKFSIDTTGTEVGVEFSYKLVVKEGELPANLKFYKSADYNVNSEITLDRKYYEYININDENRIREDTIYWNWQSSDEALVNEADNAGSGKNIVIGVELAAVQNLYGISIEESYFILDSNGALTLNPEKKDIFKNNITELIIPKVIYGREVTEISAYAFAEYSNLQIVSIPDSVTIIREGAFKDCAGMKTLVLPSSLTIIENYAFSGCTILNNVRIKDGLTAIGSWAFMDCTALANIELASTINSIGESAFYNCTSLKSIVLPQTINVINKWTFWNCTELTNISIPNTVLNIEEGAFGQCSKLALINFGIAVINIKESAFFRCESLQSITIPNSVTNIGPYAFGECVNLFAVQILSNTIVDSTAFYGCTKL